MWNALLVHALFCFIFIILCGIGPSTGVIRPLALNDCFYHKCQSYSFLKSLKTLA